MKTVVINQSGSLFRAVSGKKQTIGKTIGEALDSINSEISDEPNAVVYIQDFQPDEFFTAKQQNRMSELMDKWRFARDNNLPFSEIEQKELEELIDEELKGSAQRIAKIADKLGK